MWCDVVWFGMVWYGTVRSIKSMLHALPYLLGRWISSETWPIPDGILCGKYAEGSGMSGVCAKVECPGCHTYPFHPICTDSPSAASRQAQATYCTVRFLCLRLGLRPQNAWIGLQDLVSEIIWWFQKGFSDCFANPIDLWWFYKLTSPNKVCALLRR